MDPWIGPAGALDWTWTVWAAAGAATFAGAVIRGFTGFGFALIFIGVLNLVAVPAVVVPLSTLLDWGAGLRLIPAARRDVHWQGIRWLALGAAVGVPAGVHVLVSVPADTMSAMISAAILASVVVIAGGFRLARVPGPAQLTATGVIPGVLSGAAGIPGPAVVLLYLSAPLPVATARATAIAFFILSDSLTVAVMAWQGLIGTDALLRAVVLAPVMVLGAGFGTALFGRADPGLVRKAALLVLAVLAAVGIGRVLLA